MEIRTYESLCSEKKVASSSFEYLPLCVKYWHAHLFFWSFSKDTGQARPQVGKGKNLKFIFLNHFFLFFKVQA